MLEPYGQANPDSAKRMFERDKDVLREYGVPLELVDVDVWGTEQGYVIPKEKYYLPEIEFTPGELVALLVAAQSGGQDPAAESGARKLLYGADGGVLAGLGGGPLASGSDARSNLVHAVAEATQELRRIRFTYRTSQGKTDDRDVDAWSMVFRAGHWYLVGHDRARDDVRAFRLSRMVGEIDDTGAGSTPPEDFRAADHVNAGPWVAGGDDRAVVVFSAPDAWFAASQFPGADRDRGRRGRQGRDGDPDGRRGSVRGDAPRVRPGRGRSIAGLAARRGRLAARGAPWLSAGAACRRPPTASDGCSRSCRTSSSTPGPR